MTADRWWKRVDVGTVRALVAILCEYDQSVASSEFDQLIERFGWSVGVGASGQEAFRDERGGALRAPWDFGSGAVRIEFGNSVLRQISIRLTDIAVPNPQVRLFMQDMYVECCALTAELLGQPTRRFAGKSQETRWRGQIMTVSVVNAGSSVSLDLTSNALHDAYEIADEVDT